MLNQITEILEIAGRMAIDLYGREHGSLKADGTWVTRTDHYIETFLRSEFHAIIKNAHIFGEENGWTGEESANYVIIIDPIEGTGPFRDQIPVWGISVAIFREGQPWLGMFKMPAANHLFLGEYGKGVQWNGKPVKTPDVPIEYTSYLGVSSDAHRWDLKQYPGKIRAFGASGYHVILVTYGALQAALLTRFNFYDIAAAAIILWSAGGGLYYLSGRPVSPTDIISLQKPAEPVIACHPNYFDETREYIHLR